MSTSGSSVWDSADAITRIVIEEYIRNEIRPRIWERLTTMTATTVTLPDGSEQDATTVICKGCEMPMSDHSCGGGSVTITSAPATPTRSTGPRKAPTSRPPCPHCGGAIHFSMPGGLQNVECLMRQWYKDTGVIADANTRLPIYGLGDIADMTAWAKSLSTPITYGRMDSAAGGAGTYAAMRPKADPKPAGTSTRKKKKQAPAEEGERIEDMAGEVASDGDDLGSVGDEPITVSADSVPGRSKGKGKAKRIKTTASETPGEAELAAEILQDAAPEPVVDEAAEREQRRQERRRLLAGSAR